MKAPPEQPIVVRNVRLTDRMIDTISASGESENHAHDWKFKPAWLFDDQRRNAVDLSSVINIHRSGDASDGARSADPINHA